MQEDACFVRQRSSERPLPYHKFGYLCEFGSPHGAAGVQYVEHVTRHVLDVFWCEEVHEIPAHHLNDRA